MADLKTVKEKLGFRFGNSGVHTSRTMMLSDLEVVMKELQDKSAHQELARIIREENVLGKRTSVTRGISLQKLRSLYGLNDALPLFRVFRELWTIEKSPVLASLLARARDPLFDSSYETIASLLPGNSVGAPDFETDLRDWWGAVYQEKTLKSALRNVSSSWSQAGYLEGLPEKRRIHPVVNKTALTLALWIGYVDGFRDQRLLESRWVRSLETDEDRLETLLEVCRREGLIEYRNAGGVVEIRLNRWFTNEERELLNA